jgi:hypothetical protein
MVGTLTNLMNGTRFDIAVVTSANTYMHQRKSTVRWSEEFTGIFGDQEM